MTNLLKLVQLKPCDMYKEEYSDCKCMRARFNQYFIYGETSDCSQWKVDYENCKLWKSKNDDAAYVREMIWFEPWRQIIDIMTERMIC